jgi:hypothetical protein
MARECSKTGGEIVTPEQIARRDFDARMRAQHHFLLGKGQGQKPREADSVAELISLRREIPDVMDDLRVEGEWHFLNQKWRGVPWFSFQIIYLKQGPPSYFGIPDKP